MANVFVEESSLINIANAIREKNGSTDAYKPNEMAQAISDIQSGGGELETLYNSLMQATTISFMRSQYDGDLVFALPNTLTSLYEKFRECPKVKNITVISKNPITNCYRTFQYCPELTSITLNADTSQCTNFNMPFYNCVKLVSINGKELDFSSATNVTGCFTGCTALEEVRFALGSLSLSITIPSSKLSDESIQSIIDGLATVSTAQTLTLHRGLVLNDELKATIQGKGWTLVQ